MADKKQRKGVYFMPLVVAAISLVGLVGALVFEGSVDILFSLCAGVGALVYLYYWQKHR